MHHPNSFSRLVTAKWLASEVLKIIECGGLSSILLSASGEDPASTQLTHAQEHLVGVVCRLPDVLANRLGRYTKEGLLPRQYFKRLGEGLLGCLEGIRKLFKGT